ncbi:MAG: GntR family transcriptional regulator, partial [Gemmatimonadaceae bacterium]
MTGKRIDLIEILRQRFFSALHLGILKPGARLPSIREIEAELGVDRRAVMKAYRTLEREGIVELRQRSGVYFGNKAIGLPGLEPPEEWAVEMFARGLEMGIPVPRFGDRMNAYISRRRLRALCVECNTDQISALVA